MAENNKPVEVLRDGNLKASIFRNNGEKGPFFSTVLARTYTDERGNLHDSNVFTGSDTLRIGELARQAYSRSRELKAELGRTGDLLKDAKREGGRSTRGREPEGRASQAFERQQPDGGRRSYRRAPR